MLKLLDAIVRHQIYLEGLKGGQLRTFQTTTKAIERDVRIKLSGLHYETMDGMTKAQLRKLLADLRGTLNRHYSQYVENLIAFLRKFMEVDTEIVKSIYAEFVDEPAPEEERRDDGSLPLIGFVLPSSDRRWAAIINAPMPSNGSSLLTWIRGLSVLGTGSILLRLNQGYANREKVADTLAAIVGTDAANFRDGVLGRVSNSARAVIATALQDVAKNNEASIAQIIWPRYRWVSVLDEATTRICRSRAGVVYRYGFGPLPPAHPGCRSTTMPIAAGQDVPDMPTFGAWAKGQPADVARDMFGADRSTAHFDGSPPLTLNEYAAKTGRILQPA